MDASNATNPLFLYTTDGTLSNKALKIMGSDYTNLPNGEALTTRIAVMLRNFFKAINCTTFKNSLNNYFIDRAITIIKNQNCQFVKETFNINADFHGWCLIERILGDHKLEKSSLVKTGSQFAIIKNIYEDFKDGDKPHFKIAFNCANEMDQIDFLSKYQPEEPAADINEDMIIDANEEIISSEDEDEVSSLTGTNSDTASETISESEKNLDVEGNESKDQSEINDEENNSEGNSEGINFDENKKDDNVNMRKISQNDEERKSDSKEQNVEASEEHSLNLIAINDESNLSVNKEIKIVDINEELIHKEVEDNLNGIQEEIVKTNEELIQKEVDDKQEVKEQTAEIIDNKKQNFIRDEIKKDEIAGTTNKLILKETVLNAEIKEQNFDVIDNKDKLNLIINSDEEKKPSDPDLKKDEDCNEKKNESSLAEQNEKLIPEIKEEKQKSKKSKENIDKSSEQKKETIEPKVKVEIFCIDPEIEKIAKNSNLSTNNHSVIKGPLESSQKKRSTKSQIIEKKIVIAVEPMDQLHKAFTDEPIITGLNLFGDFLAPFLTKTNLDIVKDSLQKTASLLKHNYIPVELVGEAKIKQDIKESTREVINQLKTADFKNLLISLGKEKGGKLTNKSVISEPLNKIQKNTATLKSIAQKSVAAVTNMFLLEQLHVADKNKDAWLKDKPKLLSEKIQDIHSKLDTAFGTFVPTKGILKKVLSSKLQDKVSEKALVEIDNAIAPFIDIFVDHWSQIESKYQIFAHLTQLEALAKKIEKKQFSDSEAAIELNKLLTLTLDKNLDAFYGPLNAFLNPFMNAELS
ncbi:MAG: hypothetical protein H0T62_09420 [Parachlamydiaceae bacterium]|nr:hypothetical protein [Parachlamydiaceae bacterium]